MQKSDLEAQLGEAKDSMSQLVYVLVQALASGGTVESVAKGLQVEEEELQSLIEEMNKKEQQFDRAIALLRIDQFGSDKIRDFGWDDLEKVVLEKLRRVMPSIRDPEVLVKIAVAANRAKRSTDPVPGYSNQRADNTTVVLEGGDLGVMRISVTNRIAEQLQQPSSISKTIDGETVSKPSDGIKMIRLTEIRELMDSREKEAKDITPAEPKAKITIDPDLVESFVDSLKTPEDV